MQNLSWLDPLSFLKEQLKLVEGEDFKADSNNENYVLKSCPLCSGGASDDQWTFSIRIVDGKNQCFRAGCGWKGNLYSLYKHLFPTHQTRLSQVTDIIPNNKVYKKYTLSDYQKYLVEPLFNTPEGLKALDYLKNERKLTEETIKHFNIGFRIIKNIPFIVFPYFNDKNEVAKIKYRSVGNVNEGKKIMFCEEGMQTDLLFNSQAIKDSEEVYYVEGDIDLLTLWQLGFKNIVSVAHGVTGRKGLDVLRDKKKIYILFDQDIEAQKQAQNIAKLLGLNKVFNITLPEGYKDPNELLQKEGDEKAKAILEDSISKSKKIDLEFIVPFYSAVNTLIEESLFGGQLGENVIESPVRFPFDNLHKITGNLGGGDFVILSGSPGCGKTTLLLQMAFETAKKGTPVFFFCLEMPFKRLVKKVIQYALGVEDITAEHLEKIHNTFSGLPLYFINRIQSFSKEWVFSVIEEAIVRYNIGLVMFDNLHLICRDDPRYIREEIGKAVQNFKLVAEKHNIPVLLIAQLRKVDPNTIPTAIDLRESNTLVTDPDIIIFLYRQPLFSSKGADLDGTETTDLFSQYTLIRVEKCRYDSTGEVWLVYEGNLSKFREMKDDQERLGILQERQLVQQIRKANKMDRGH